MEGTMTSITRMMTLGGGLAVLMVCLSAQGAQIGSVASPSDPIKALNQRIAALEARVQALEAGQAAFKKALSQPYIPDHAPESTRPTNSGAASAPASSGAAQGALNRVRAPFVVVDGKGQVLFRVQDPAAANGEGGGNRGIYVYDESGRTSASLTAAQGGGILKVSKPASNTYVTAAANDQGVGMMVREDGNPRAFAGVGARGAGRIYIYAGGGENPKAGLTTYDTDNKGLVAAFSGETAVAMLSESQKHPGGGQVTVTDPNGDGVFSAAYDGDEGAACVGHKQKLHCLGVQLP